MTTHNLKCQFRSTFNVYLPNPNGPLSFKLPSSAIQQANNHMSPVIERQASGVLAIGVLAIVKTDIHFNFTIYVKCLLVACPWLVVWRLEVLFVQRGYCGYSLKHFTFHRDSTNYYFGMLEMVTWSTSRICLTSGAFSESDELTEESAMDCHLCYYILVLIWLSVRPVLSRLGARQS